YILMDLIIRPKKMKKQCFPFKRKCWRRMALRDKNSKNQPYKNRTFFDSIRNAYQGVCTVFQEERNMSFHNLTTIVSIYISLLLSIAMDERLWDLMVFIKKIIIEIWIKENQKTIDMFSQHYHPLAKKKKDMTEASVLFI